MTIKIPAATRNAMLDLLVDKADAGAAAGTIKMYTGAQPANADAAATGTLLATFTLADPAFAAAASGSVALDADPALTTTAVASGTAGWARVADSDGLTVFDGSVGTSAADFIVASTTVATGQNLSLNSGSLAI